MSMKVAVLGTLLSLSGALGATPCYPTSCGTCVSSKSLADSISKECVNNEWVGGSPRGPWSTLAPLPVKQGDNGAGLVVHPTKGKALLTYASYWKNLPKHEAYMYFFSTNSWEAITPPPIDGDHMVHILYDNQMWVFGGTWQDGEGGNYVQIYSVDSDSWRISDVRIPWQFGAGSGALIGDRIYLCGGFNVRTTVRTCAFFDPKTETFDVSMADMPYGRNHAAFGTDGTNFWIMTGRGVDDGVSNGQKLAFAMGYNTTQVYYPATNTWKSSRDHPDELTPGPVPRGGVTKLIFYKGEIWVIGGSSMQDVVPNADIKLGPLNLYYRIDIYNPLRRTWREGPDMHYTCGATSPIFDKETNKVYFIGGAVREAPAAPGQTLLVLDLNGLEDPSAYESPQDTCILPSQVSDSDSLPVCKYFTECAPGTYLHEMTKKCVVCGVGFACNNNERTQCSEGTYSSSSNAKECSDCPAGSFCTGGVVQLCPSGSFSDSLLQSSCKPCPSTYSCPTEGTDSPVKCKSGMFALEGAIKCSQCPRGFMCQEGVQIACSAGTYSEAGAKDCSLCQKGYYCINGTSTKCSAGTYSFGGSVVCSICEAGTYSAAASTVCPKCPSNTFSTISGAKSINSCIPCGEGTVAPEGSIACSVAPTTSVSTSTVTTTEESTPTTATTLEERSTTPTVTTAAPEIKGTATETVNPGVTVDAVDATAAVIASKEEPVNTVAVRDHVKAEKPVPSKGTGLDIVTTTALLALSTVTLSKFFTAGSK